MESAGYPFLLRVEVTSGTSFSELEGIINNSFVNDCDIVPHQSNSRCYLVRHRNQHVANGLLREQFLWTEAGGKLTFCPEDVVEGGHSLEVVSQDYSSSEDGDEGNIQNNDSSQQSISGESGIQASFMPQSDNKKKLDDLKPYENVILFKTKFIGRLANSELSAIHKAPDKLPVLSGPSQFIREAEFKVMKFLRRITQEEINLLSEMTDEAKRKKMCNKIISQLEEKFGDSPLAFENHNGQIIIYSSEADKLEEAKNYLQGNFHRECIPVNEATTFKYIETHLKTDIDKMAGANDLVSIFPLKTIPGYVVMVYGNKKEFEDFKIKLKTAIEGINRAELELDITNISENAGIMIGGIEKKWNVMVDVLGPGKPRAAVPNGAVIKGVTVTFIEGKIEDQKVDVLVSSTGRELNLAAGPVAKSISMKAGPELQKECSTKAPLAVGQVIETKAYNLPCKRVFHCLAKDWNEGTSKESQEILMKIISTCIQMANDKGLTSIAFPPIACGVLKMPPKISAECILSSIENYAWSSQHSLKNIIIAIYDPKKVAPQLYQLVLRDKMNSHGSAWKNSEGLKISIIGSSQDSLNNACRSLSALSLL